MQQYSVMKKHMMQLEETAVKACRRPYRAMTMTPLEMEVQGPLLAASVINNSEIEAVGQELGLSYDMSTSIDSNTGKTFSHEWESSN